MPARFSRITFGLLQRLGLKGTGWHTFRHTYRAWLDAIGAPLGVQQKLMRHAHSSTTGLYKGALLMSSKREGRPTAKWCAWR
jgi:integrase